MKPGTTLLLKAVLALVAVGFLVAVVDPAEVVATAAAADPVWIGAALALLPLNLFLDGYAWRMLLRHVMPGVRLREVFGALFTGHALGFFTPARAGEYAGRAFYLAHDDKWELGVVLFVQRMLELVATAAVGLVVFVPFVRAYAPPGGALWWGVAAWGLGAVLMLSALVLAPARVYRLGRRVLPADRLADRIAFLRRTPRRTMLTVLALGLLRFGVFSTQLVLLFRAFTPGADAVRAYWGVLLTFFAKALLPPLTFMDLGIREGAAVFFLGTLGFPQAAALDASLLLLCVNLVLPAALGVPFVFRLRLGGRRGDETMKRGVEETGIVDS